MEPMAGTHYLLYDAECRICTRVARWTVAVAPRGRLRIQPTEASRYLLAGLPEDVVRSAYHVVSPDGRVTTGGDAVPALLEVMPMGAGFGRLLRGSQSLMERIRTLYGFAATFRGALTCRVDGSSDSAC